MEKQKRTSLPYWLMLLLAAVIYSLMALSDNIWADEAYTFAMLRHSFGEIWQITAADVHPPLYYFAAKLFSMPFGYSQYAVRLFSGICYFVILAVGGAELTRLFGRKTGLAFMVLFLMYPFALEHAVEARMYALSSLAVFLCALFAYRAWLENRVWDWIGFTAAGLCAGYSHYFALVAAGVLYGLLFVCCLARRRKLLKPWLAASAVTIVLYLPWLKCFLEQLAYKVSNEYWITPITIESLVNDIIYLLHANGTGIFPLFFGLLGLGLAVQLVREKAAVPLLALAVPVLTLLLGVCVSMVIRPVFIIRYLVPCAPLIIFFVACGISTIRREALLGGAAAVLLTAFSGNLMVAIADILPNPDKFGSAAVAQASQAEAYVVLVDNHLHVSQVAAYYGNGAPIFTPETLGAANPYTNIDLLPEFSPEDYSCFVIFTNPDSEPDRSLCEHFRATKLGTYFAAYDTFDLWLMERS
ncbi:MAG: glycosyltransferase family 39 protein [Faecousia sp.]